MRRSTKNALTALGSAVLAWVIGTYLIGVASVRTFTSSGEVDMMDPHAINRALADPSFTVTYSWGSFILEGNHWGFSFPLLLALLSFASAIILMRRRSRAVSGKKP